VLAKANSKNVDGGILAYLTNHFSAQLAEIDQQIQELYISNPPTSLLPFASTVVEDSDGIQHSPLAEFFKAHLDKYAAQKVIMNDIPDTIVINNILLDMKTLKEVFLPNPERCFNDIVNILPDVARDRNELLLGEIQAWIRIIRNPPASVEYFVEYLVWLEHGTFPFLRRVLTVSSTYAETNGELSFGNHEVVWDHGCA
jgi:hypothetical protein